LLLSAHAVVAVVSVSYCAFFTYDIEWRLCLQQCHSRIYCRTSG
jgi:hypothetical protein